MKFNKYLYINNLLNSFDDNELFKLEAWRGLLALLVVIAHANQVFIMPITGSNTYLYWVFGAIAHFSVLGFFVISGISIAMSIALNIKRNKNIIDIKEFVISRISRIYPPLLFSVLLCLIFKFIMIYYDLLGINESYRLKSDLDIVRDFFEFSINDVIQTLKFNNVGLVKVNGPLWSLIYEWWLYFFGVLLVNVFITKKIFYRLVSVILLIAVYNKIKHTGGSVYILIWILGFIFYIIGEIRYKLNNFILVLSIFGLLISNYYLDFFGNKTDLSTIPIVQVLFSILFLMIIFKFRINRIFNRISKFSYTLYIIHFPVFLFLLSIFHKCTNQSISLSLILGVFGISSVMLISYFLFGILENKKYYFNLLNSIIKKSHLILNVLLTKLNLFS
ncbi:acyltransferase family protein [Flavobacterium psychrophilum]|uniref:acyltransferase family protein n=1 Tax=Flavobacterium psychrophilum TaxID=96345 RepID=UPI001D092D92|nr:acyltransferase [Flavobacterium psychrophilum]EKT3956844.1 acyltransferase [Flavobacterium psychrophilum]EKT4508453.1 acyltransferase [Flavobacterium psychrophilum]MCB6088582.1 acyltransferase [Flavobacterium psychrophilum]